MTITTNKLRNTAYIQRLFHAIGIAGFVLIAGPVQAMAPAAPAQTENAAQVDMDKNQLSPEQQELLRNLKFKKRAENVMDYFIPVTINALTNSAMAYEQGGKSAVIDYVLKPTAIDIAKDGAKYSGKKGIIALLKKGLSVAPHSGQKKVIGWGVGGLISGIDYGLRRDSNKNWLSRFIMQRWLPSFVQSQIVHFAYQTAVTATGIDYPEFVQKRDWLHHLAKILIPAYTHAALSFAYDYAYSYLTKPKIAEQS